MKTIKKKMASGKLFHVAVSLALLAMMATLSNAKPSKSEVAMVAQSEETRCLGFHNDTCVGIYPTEACEGEYVAYRCADPRKRQEEIKFQEGRGCSTSYRVYGWKQIATNAQTPSNKFYAVNDDACDYQCGQYRKAGYWVVGWTRTSSDGTCQCFTTPYGDGNVGSAVIAQATTGFYRNSDTGWNGCGAYTIRGQKTWSGVASTFSAYTMGECESICGANFRIKACALYLPGANCFCLTSTWLSPNPMTYAPAPQEWITSFIL